MTWLLGNKLIKVTTSGCSVKALKNGLCDKCWLLCRADKGESQQTDTATLRRIRNVINENGQQFMYIYCILYFSILLHSFNNQHGGRKENTIILTNGH
jgi:hypothetical protein